MLDPIVATLKDRVKASGKTQGTIAGELFISQGYLSEILRGSKTPPLPTLRLILDYFDLDLMTVAKIPDVDQINAWQREWDRLYATTR